jgi:hypothetical protein
MKIPYVLVALAVCGAAHAQESPAEPKAGAEGAATTFESLDANHNGSLNRHEAKADPSLVREFGVVDRNYDHQIDRAEFARFEASRSGERTTRRE